VPLYEICNPEVKISGLTNAVHDDGLIMLKNENTGGVSVNGTWSSADFSVTSKLGLMLGVGLSGDVFHFSFQVVNPNFAQSGNPSVRLNALLRDGRNPEAFVVSMSEKKMKTPVSVSPVAFRGKALADTDDQCNTVETSGQCVKFADDNMDRRPLFIRPIFFIKKKIGQSNAEPCAHTTITVTLETSVPIFTRCNPKLTIQGLDETVELVPSSLLPPVNATDFTNNFIGSSPNASAPFALDSFHRLNQRMVISFANSTMAGLAYTFSFTVRHRSIDSSGVDLKLSMATVTTDFHGSLETAVTHKTAYGYVFTGTDRDANSAFPMLAGTNEEKPMFVKKLRFRGYIGQTSFHPCDNNVIWVKIEAHRLRLYYSCNPKITITGLTGTQTSSGELDVFDDYRNDTIVKGLWNNDQGSLEVKLTDMYNKNTSDDSTYKLNFLFHFTVQNPAKHQNPRVPRIDGELSLLKTGPYATNIADMGLRPEGSSQTAVTNVGPVGVTSCSGSAACAMDLFTPQKWSTLVLTNRTDGAMLTVDTPGNSAFSLPVYVKELIFEIKQVRQTSPYPCDLNEIIVDVATNVKVLQVCQPVLTIMGLMGSYSDDNPAAAVTNKATCYNNPSWIDYLGDQCKDYNSTGCSIAQNRVAVPYEVKPKPSSSSAVLTGQCSICTCSAAGVISAVPQGDCSACECKKVPGPIGFVEGSDATKECCVCGASANGNSHSVAGSTFFMPAASWTRTPGQIVVPLGDDLPSSKRVAFSFKLYNPNQPMVANVQLSVSMRLQPFFAGRPDVSSSVAMEESEDNAPNTIYKFNTAPYSGTKEAWPLKVRSLVFETKTIRQSTPHSGCFNTITVTLQTNVPLLPNVVCQPKITMSGLNKANHTAGKIALVAPAGACPVGVNRADIFKSAAGNRGVEEFGVWSQSNFAVSLFSAVPTTAGTSYVFSFQVQNPHAGPNSVDIPGGIQKAAIVKIHSYGPQGTLPSVPGDLRDSLPGIPADQINMDNVVERPCCLCNVDHQDTGVMRVKAPVFCTKNIGQSSPWPCDMNTLTVTITPTTILYGNISTITISGLVGAQATSGALKIDDGSNGQRHDLLFATKLQSNGGVVGHVNWIPNDNSGILVLHLVQNMECNGEYIVSFKVQNPDDGQAAQIIMIEANDLHPERPNTKIVAAAMVPDDERIPVVRGVKGDSKPLFVRDPVFTVRNIVQASSTPCDVNTISVSLKSTVPFFASCSPKITLKGLLGSDTKSEARRYETIFANCSIPDCTGSTSNCTFSFTRIEPTLGTSHGVLSGKDACEGNGFDMTQCNAVGCCAWSSAQSTCNAVDSTSVCVLNTTCTTSMANTTLKGLSITKDPQGDAPFEPVGDWNKETGTLVLPVVNNYDDVQDIVFSFELRNPSRGQSANTVIAQVEDGIKFNLAEANTMVTPVLPNGPSATDKDSPLYPLSVDTAFWTVRKIAQDSPWPCDENTISVSFTSSTRLLTSCSPMLTIKGLDGMGTNSSMQFPVTDQGGDVLADWDQDAGRLVLDLSLLQGTDANTTELSGFNNQLSYVKIQSFNFSFVLRNPAASRDKQPVNVVAIMKNVQDQFMKHAIMASKSESRNVVFQDVDSAQGVTLDDKNHLNNAGNHSASRALGSTTQALRVDNDDDYGYIRPIEFTTRSIQQKIQTGGNLPTIRAHRQQSPLLFPPACRF